MIDKREKYLNIELSFEEYDEIVNKYGCSKTPIVEFINKGNTWVIKIVEW